LLWRSIVALVVGVNADEPSVTGRAEVVVEGHLVRVHLAQEWRTAYGGSAELLGLDIVGQVAAASAATWETGVTAWHAADHPQLLAALSSPDFVSRVLTATEQFVTHRLQEPQVHEHASQRREVVVTTTGGRVTGVRFDPEWVRRSATQKINDTLTAVLDEAAGETDPQPVDLQAFRNLQAEAADLLSAEADR
jgi:hypothetical protein